VRDPREALARAALGGGPMSFTQVCASLCGEPFHLRPWEIERLDPRQIRNVYFHPRDDKGELERRHQAPAPDGPAQFRAFWRARGFSDDEVALLWRQQQGVPGG
jgi:hypothetical protein